MRSLLNLPKCLTEEEESRLKSVLKGDKIEVQNSRKTFSVSKEFSDLPSIFNSEVRDLKFPIKVIQFWTKKPSGFATYSKYHGSEHVTRFIRIDTKYESRWHPHVFRDSRFDTSSYFGLFRGLLHKRLWAICLGYSADKCSRRATQKTLPQAIRTNFDVVIAVLALYTDDEIASLDEAVKKIWERSTVVRIRVIKRKRNASTLA